MLIVMFAVGVGVGTATWMLLKDRTGDDLGIPVVLGAIGSLGASAVALALAGPEVLRIGVIALVSLAGALSVLGTYAWRRQSEQSARRRRRPFRP